MAVRVTADDVGNIIDTDLASTLVNAFIMTANTIVDENLLNCGLSDALLVQIELWLAAHLVAIRDQREVRIDALQAEVEYHVPKFGMGLQSTMYGQMALALDKSGRLAALGNQRGFIEVL